MPRQKQKQSQKVIVNIHKPKGRSGRRRAGVSSKSPQPIVIQSHHHHQAPQIGYAEHMGIRNNNLEDVKLQGVHHMVIGLAEREKARQEQLAKLIHSNNLLVAKHNADKEKVKEDKLKQIQQSGGIVRGQRRIPVMQEMKERKMNGGYSSDEEESMSSSGASSIVRRYTPQPPSMVGYSETIAMDPVRLQTTGGFDLRGYKSA